MENNQISPATVSASNLIALDVPVIRDEFGYWSNPGIPDFDEDHDKYKNWLAAQRIELTCAQLENEDDTHPAYVSFFEDGELDISTWCPDRPDGEGWHDYSIHVTEDGVVWVWARRAGESK